MGIYDGMGYPELQAEAKGRGLLATGTKDDLMARLEQADADLILEGEPAAPTTTDDLPADPPAVELSPPPAPDFDLGTPPPPPPEPVVATGVREYKVAFPCPHELTDGLHEEYRMRAYHQAVEKGHVPRGGLGPVARTGWAQVEGVRHAVYTVPIRS